MLCRLISLLGVALLVGCGCQPSIDSAAPISVEAPAPAVPTDDVAEATPARQNETSPDADTGGDTVDPSGTADTQPAVKPVGAQPANSDDVELITFDDLNIGMPVDAKFREVMLTYNDGRANDLLGKRVNVAGYMNATDSLTGVKEFILLRNLECKFGPGGQADHLVHVILTGGLETEFTDQVVYVEGELRLNPFPQDGPATWSIYDLEATKVSTTPPPRRR